MWLEVIKELFSEILGRFFRDPVSPKPLGTLGASETKKDAKEGEVKRVSSEKVESIVHEDLKEIRAKVKAESKERLDSELRDLPKKNKGLNQLLDDLVAFCYAEFQKEVVITMIHRTPEEQDYLYRDSPSYQKKKFRSPHEFWHAIDLRSWIYTKGQRDKLVAWLNEHGTNRNNYYSWTAKVHEVGSNGLHFHVQYVAK